MCRVYRGIVQPHKKAFLAQRVSVISNRSGTNVRELSSITSHWRRNRLQWESSTTSVISDCNRTTSISSCESSTSEPSQRITHRRVTFSLQPQLTIHEQTDEQEIDVFEDDIVITNPELVNETETDFNENDSASNKEVQL